MQPSLRDDPSRRGQPRAQDTGQGLSDTGTSSGPWTGPPPHLGLSPLPSDRLGTCSQLRWSAVAHPSPPRSIRREPARATVRRAGVSCILPLLSPLLVPSAPDVRPALALAPPFGGVSYVCSGAPTFLQTPFPRSLEDDHFSDPGRLATDSLPSGGHLLVHRQLLSWDPSKGQPPRSIGRRYLPSSLLNASF